MESRHPIRVENLSVGYEGKAALRNVSLSVPEGHLLALIGPNGSGKTTLLKALLGLLTLQEGTVLLHNRVLQAYSPKEKAKQIAYVSQQPPSGFPLTVFELVSLGRYPYASRFGRDEDRTAAEEALALTDSLHLSERRFITLSGGEKQKVLLSRALAQSRGVLLLDEPTVHLDLYYQLEVLNTVKRLCHSERRTTVIAVLHEMNLVSLFADQVAMLRAGKLYALGAVTEVLTEKNIEEVFNVTMNAREDGDTGARYFVPRHRSGSG